MQVSQAETDEKEKGSVRQVISVSSCHWFDAALCRRRSQGPSTKTSHHLANLCVLEVHLSCHIISRGRAQGMYWNGVRNKGAAVTLVKLAVGGSVWLHSGSMDELLICPSPMVRQPGSKAYIKTHTTVLTYGVIFAAPKARHSRLSSCWDSNALLSLGLVQSHSFIHCVSGSLFKALRTLIFHRHN